MESKEEGKDQESIPSSRSTTPDPIFQLCLISSCSTNKGLFALIFYYNATHV